MSTEKSQLRDARFVRALEHAPDADAAPSDAVRASILEAAREAVAPVAVAGAAPVVANSAVVQKAWWKQLWPFYSSEESAASNRGRLPWDAAFATILVGGIVTLLWHGKDVPDGPAMRDEVAVVQTPADSSTVAPPSVAREPAPAPAPSAAPAPAEAPVPAPVPAAKPAPDKSAPPIAPAPTRTADAEQERAKEIRQQMADASSREKKSESSASVGVAQAPATAPAPAAAPAPVARAAEDAVAQSRNENPADRRQRSAMAESSTVGSSGSSAGGSVAAVPPQVVAQAAPGVSEAMPAPAAPPAPAAAPAPAAVAPTVPQRAPAALAKSAAPAAAPAIVQPPAAAMAAVGAPQSSNWPALWTQMRVRSGSSTVLVTRAGTGRLPSLLAATAPPAARKDRATQSSADKANANAAAASGFASAPPVVLELVYDGGTLGTYELNGDQWRFTPARGGSGQAQDAAPSEMGVMSPAQAQAVRAELTRLGLTP